MAFSRWLYPVSEGHIVAGSGGYAASCLSAERSVPGKTSWLADTSSQLPLPRRRFHNRLHPPVSHVSFETRQSFATPARRILPGLSHEDPEVRHRPPARYSILACCTPRHGSSSPHRQPHCREEETSLAQRENRATVPRMFLPHHSSPWNS